MREALSQPAVPPAPLVVTCLLDAIACCNVAFPLPRDRDEIPTGKVRRAATASSALGPSGAKLAASMIASLRRDPERAREILEARHAEFADHAVSVLGNLRGGAMKVGQLASFVDVEFLPPE